MFAMEDVVKMYENLLNQNAAAVIPGTSVPGHGVVADGICTTNTCSTETVDTQADTVVTSAIGVAADGSKTDTVDPKSLQAGILASSVKPDGADPKAVHTGENTDGVKDGVADDENGKGEKDVGVADKFSELPRSLKVITVAKEFAGNVEIYRMGKLRFCYDSITGVCVRIINKPTEKDGNISKLIRNNVCSSHAVYVLDSIAKDVFSWLMDSDTFSTALPEEKFNVPPLILLNNGYYDLSEGCFVKGNAKSLGFFFSVKVDAVYVDAPLAPLSNEFFSNVCLEAKELVLAANGILLSNVRTLKKSFFFLGPRNSGKTTMENFTGSIILPRDNYLIRNLTLARLGGRFSPSALMDAHFSWAGDIGAKEFTRSAFDNFKILTGNDPFEAEVKFKDLRKCMPKCALAFNCNSFPRFPMAWDYGSDDEIEEGAGRNRIVLFHTRQTFTDEMQIAYKKKNGMTVEQALAADKDAIVSEMIRQAGRVYRGELNFPVPAIGEVYSEGKSLKERFFFLVETQCPLTGNPADVIPLQELISTYKYLHPDEILPYRDPIAEERAFGAMLNYVCKLDQRYEQAKKKVPGYPNPVSCLIGCRFQDSKKTNKP